MSMIRFLDDRVSTRRFKKDEANYHILDAIGEDIDNILEEEKAKELNIYIYENGENLYSLLKDKGGYSGVMIESPHYIVIERENNSKRNILETGYIGEKIITKLNDRSLDTCWITLDIDDKELAMEVFGEDTKIIDYIIGFGYSKSKKIFNSQGKTHRKSIDELVFNKEMGNNISLDILEKRGLKDIFYYAGFAPSRMNLQPWKFILKDNSIELYIEYDNWEDGLLVDIGIMMYYFESLANTEGIIGEWTRTEDKDIEFNGMKYRRVGEFNL